MLWLLITLIKIAISIALIIAFSVCYIHFSAKRKIVFYHKQGAVSPKGVDTFFIGNVVSFIEWMRKRESLTDADAPLKPSFQWLMDT